MLRNRCLNEIRALKTEQDRIDPEKIKSAELQFLYQLDILEREGKSVEEMLIESMKSACFKLSPKLAKELTTSTLITALTGGLGFPHPQKTK